MPCPCPADASRTFIEVSSIVSSQTIDDIGSSAPQAVTFDTVFKGDGFATPTLPGSVITIPTTGDYSILYSVQCLGISGNTKVDLFLRVNGSPVANSSSRSSLKNNDEIVLTCSYLLPLSAGDTLELVATSDTQPFDILVVPSPIPSIPLAPGVIFSVIKLR